MGQCCLRIKDALPRLSTGEASVASYILKDPESIVDMSISELSNACSVSAATVVRFCKNIGCRGFKDLCVQLSLDITTGQHTALEYSDIRPGDSMEAIINNVRENSINGVNHTLNIMDRSVLGSVVDSICAASRVDFYGTGSSGLLALDAQYKFLRIGKSSISSEDSAFQIISASTLKRGDVAVFISYTGETKDTIELAEIAKGTGATTVSITNFGTNTLSGITDYSLHIVSEENIVRSGPMSSRISLLTAIDVIFSLTVSRVYDDVKASLDKSFAAMLTKKTMKCSL